MLNIMGEYSKKARGVTALEAVAGKRQRDQGRAEKAEGNPGVIATATLQGKVTGEWIWLLDVVVCGEYVCSSWCADMLLDDVE